jgi:hypothetical protein
LLTFGIGLPDLMKSQAGADREIRFAEAHPDGLEAKIRRYDAYSGDHEHPFRAS